MDGHLTFWRQFRFLLSDFEHTITLSLSFLGPVLRLPESFIVTVVTGTSSNRNGGVKELVHKPLVYL